MKITNMEEVAKNVGKKVYYQEVWYENPIIGTVQYGEFYDCDGDLMGYEDEYSIRYEEPNEDELTWNTIDDVYFRNNIIILLETIE